MASAFEYFMERIGAVPANSFLPKPSSNDNAGLTGETGGGTLPTNSPFDWIVSGNAPSPINPADTPNLFPPGGSADNPLAVLSGEDIRSIPEQTNTGDFSPRSEGTSILDPLYAAGNSFFDNVISAADPNKWWTVATQLISNLFQRAGLVLLGIILIGAAAWGMAKTDVIDAVKHKIV